jgi:hypothetical protein
MKFPSEKGRIAREGKDRPGRRMFTDLSQRNVEYLLAA